MIAIALLFVRVPYANTDVRVFLQEQLQNAVAIRRNANCGVVAQMLVDFQHDDSS